MFNVAQIDSLPVTSTRLGQATRRDRVLGKVWRYTKSGWPQDCPVHLQPYWTRRHELTVEGDCLLWGIRVVVPLSLQERVLQELHQEHQGVTKMKTLARSYILDKEIEGTAKDCRARQSVKSAHQRHLYIPGSSQLSLGRDCTSILRGRFKETCFSSLLTLTPNGTRSYPSIYVINENDRSTEEPICFLWIATTGCLRQRSSVCVPGVC